MLLLRQLLPVPLLPVPLLPVLLLQLLPPLGYPGCPNEERQLGKTRKPFFFRSGHVCVRTRFLSSPLF